MSDLRGKVAIVLGASAEAGTGWAIAERLGAAGAKVVVGARSETPLKRLAAHIGGLAKVCDAKSESDVQQLVNTAVERFGRLDIAVNSAGATALGLIADCTDMDLQAMLQLNFFGHVYFVRHAAAAMKAGGSIVLVSSLSTTHPVFPNFAYAAAKSATDCLVRYAALEYGPRNIRVNSILPGPIMTDLGRELFSNPGVVKAFEKEIPLGRIGNPSDFADAVLWLAGPAYVTGLNIPVCGGLQLNRFPFTSELPGGDQAWEKSGPSLYDRNTEKSC